MSLFDNGDPEDFLLFIRNFNMTLAASGSLEAGAKYQYLCILVREEALCLFYSFSVDVGGTEILNIDYIIRGLAH